MTRDRQNTPVPTPSPIGERQSTLVDRTGTPRTNGAGGTTQSETRFASRASTLLLRRILPSTDIVSTPASLQRRHLGRHSHRIALYRLTGRYFPEAQATRILEELAALPSVEVLPVVRNIRAGHFAAGETGEHRHPFDD